MDLKGIKCLNPNGTAEEKADWDEMVEKLENGGSEIEENDMHSLAAKLKFLRDKKDTLAELTKTNNADIERLEYKLSDTMIDKGYDGFELNGFKFSLAYKDVFNTKVEYRDLLIDALRIHGIERSEIITETIPAQKLNSIMKTIYSENGEKLPDEFTMVDGELVPIITVFSKQGVTVRKVRGKGGKSKTGMTFFDVRND